LSRIFPITPVPQHKHGPTTQQQQQQPGQGRPGQPGQPGHETGQVWAIAGVPLDLAPRSSASGGGSSRGGGINGGARTL